MADQSKSQLALIEEEILKAWDKEDTFNQSTRNRKGQPAYSFYDGPPFANGLPHFGHSLVQSIKDSLGRYKTMRGFYVERRNGWDCHGLPVEFEIEKKFGISGKKQITELGIDKFNMACRDSIFLYKEQWEEFFKRIGRWTEVDNYYATVDRDYTESVWWAINQIHEQELLYRGFKSVAYCPRCETPLSNFEVNEGYKDNVSDPSLYVKFKLKEEDAYLLGWTTTPWSLPGNAALAVQKSEVYTYVQVGDEVLILAKKRLEQVFKDETEYEVVREVKGSELVGKSYLPPFRLDRFTKDVPEAMYRIYHSSTVSVDDGTGVLHVAPAFGEDDLVLGQQHGLEVLSTVDGSGKLTGGIGFDDVKGKFFKSTDRPIIQHLTEAGLVFAAETFEHTYPFCWRCDTPLIYYAINTWYVAVSKVKDRLVSSANAINWMPAHIKRGRFGKWLEGARDWAISRNRYWGAPLPIWVNEKDENDYIVVSSTEQLMKLSGIKELDDLHRPGIDEIVIKKKNKIYRRVPEVLDCWFESGSMPLAQVHYPFEDEKKFKSSFPADYIGEGLDQTSQWFYVLHVISTIIFNKPAYKNVLVNGMIMAADGRKLSKRLKNYPPVDEVFNNEGADSLRLYLLSNYQATAGEYMRFKREDMRDINRNILGTLMNSFNFFKMYSDIDKWTPNKPGVEPKSNNQLDKWILSRLNQTTQEVTFQADSYKIAHAIEPIFKLIDDLSNWYIRRSRRRFWKSEDDNDKVRAYETLWHVLLQLTQLLSPWAPFISDYIWRGLVKNTNLEKSVHLSDWPQPGKINQDLIDSMETLRKIITEGLNQRAAASVKVRQPLASITVPKSIFTEVSISDGLLSIIAEELNVKEVKTSGGIVKLDTKITPELKSEGLMREVIRHIQSTRKKAGLNVDDRIALNLRTKDRGLSDAIEAHKNVITAETLTRAFNEVQNGFEAQVQIEGVPMDIRLKKF